MKKSDIEIILRIERRQRIMKIFNTKVIPPLLVIFGLYLIYLTITNIVPYVLGGLNTP